MKITNHLCHIDGIKLNQNCLLIKQIVCPHRVLHFYKIASGLPLLGDRYAIINVMISSLVDVDNNRITTAIDTNYCMASTGYFSLRNDLPFL